MEKFWICYVEGTNGGKHYRHGSLENAMTEAERLARLPWMTGKNVFVLECIGCCHRVIPPVIWLFPRFQQFPKYNPVNQRQENINSHNG